MADRLIKFVAEHVLQGVDSGRMHEAPFRLDVPIRIPFDFATDEGGVAIVVPAPDESVSSRALYRSLVPLVDEVVRDALRADGSYIAGARLDMLGRTPAIVVTATAPSVESLDLVTRIHTALANVEHRFSPNLFDQLREVPPLYRTVS